MKTYFPDDPVKQERLELLVSLCNEYKIKSPDLYNEIILTINEIEKATNEKIEEVLK